VQCVHSAAAVYNCSMNETPVKKRKRRSDRMHIVYVLINTVTNQMYVGISVCIDRSGKETLAARWSRHCGRAFNENKNWALCQSIRKYSPDVFVPVIYDFVRGKLEAHSVETELRKTGMFALNTA
jgi:hypothetical protein